MLFPGFQQHKNFLKNQEKRKESFFEFDIIEATFAIRKKRNIFTAFFGT
jgi:hypothetical protein